MTSITNQDRLNHLINVINRAIEIVNPIDVKSPPIKFSEYEYFHHSFIRRYKYNLAAISSLLPAYVTNSAFITPVSVILRAGLLDFITQCYLLSAHTDYSNQETNEEYELRAREVWESAILRELKSIESQFKMHEIDNQEFLRQMKLVNKHVPSLFESFNESTGHYSTNLKKEVSVTKMFRKLTENKIFKQYKAAYSLYDFYSKVEHFGGFSNFIHALHQKDTFLHSNRIIHGTVFIFRGILFSIEQSNYEEKQSLLHEMEYLGKEFLQEPLKKIEKK